MVLEELVERFTQLPGAVVGRGPRHPVQPDPSIAPRIEWLLENYPRLRRYQSYVDFLEMFAGATIENEDPNGKNLVHVLGFGEEFFEIDVDWSGEGEIETDGYIVFAICAYHRDRERELDTYEYDFALETSGARRPGIYRAVSAMHALDQPIQLSW